MATACLSMNACGCINYVSVFIMKVGSQLLLIIELLTFYIENVNTIEGMWRAISNIKQT